MPGELATAAFVLLVLLTTVVSLGPAVPNSTPNIRANAELRPDVTPCLGALGQVLFTYNWSHATISACYYPTSQTPVLGQNYCVETWEFAVPTGATQVEAQNLPVVWTFESAGPGNVSVLGGNLFYVSYASTPTDSQSTFELQMAGPCAEDPGFGNVNASIAALSARITSLSAQVTSLFSALQGVNLTAQTRISAVRYLVSQALLEENASYSYRLTAGTAIRVGNTFTFPLFLATMNGSLANASLTGQVCRGLSVTFVNATQTTPLNWTPRQCGIGRLSVAVPLTTSEITALSNGSAVLTLASPVQSGTFTNLAGGAIGSAQVTGASQAGDWWSTIFGITTPPPAENPASVGDVISDLAWWGDSTAGRAVYALTSIIAILVYVHEAHKAARRQIAAKAASAGGSK